MNFLDAAFRVLQAAGQPLHFNEITARALTNGFLNTQGKTPAATMGSRLYVDTRLPTSRFKRVDKGVFGLADAPKEVDEITQRVAQLNLITRHALAKRLQMMPADQFEVLVGELLIALGFEEESVTVTSYKGDKGIDVTGVLNAVGIAKIEVAVQVKRWKNNVQAPDVQSLRGSLTTDQTGILITTAGFSKGAQAEAVAPNKSRINLIDGQQLLDLMILHGIGINKTSHEVLALDAGYWGTLDAPSPPSAPPPPAAAMPAATPAAATPGVVFPLTVRAGNNASMTAVLHDIQGTTTFAGQRYSSVSAAGKAASGWKQCNGWQYWRYQRPDGSWGVIAELKP